MTNLLQIVIDEGNKFYRESYTIEDLRHPGREVEKVSIRFAFVYLSKLYTNHTSMRISEEINRESTTVLHCFREVNLASKNPKFAHQDAYQIAMNCREKFVELSGQSKENDVREMKKSIRNNLNSRDQRVKLAKALFICSLTLEEIKKSIESDKDVDGWVKSRVLQIVNDGKTKIAAI